MQFQETKLPWSNFSVRSTGNLHPYLLEKLPDTLGDYLPDSLTMFFDSEIAESDVLSFIHELQDQLISEFRHREVHISKFVKLGLFNETEIHAFLTKHRHVQPWALYYSITGELGISSEDIYKDNAMYGIIPSPVVSHTGLAWRKTQTSSYNTWLVTVFKLGQDCNWSVDIGHESAHSAFAPVALFSQSINSNSASINLPSAISKQELNSVHLAQISCLYSEIAVAGIRGENRPFQSGVDGAAQREQLYILLDISHQLMPDLWFDQALAAYERVNGVIDIEQDDEVFEICAAIMRIIPHLATVNNHLFPPTLAWYQSIKHLISTTSTFTSP